MTLELILNHHYYRMIESGNKDEEYRRMCNHWKNRIWKNRDKITAVRFHKGYTSENMTFKVNSIRVGIGDESLGAPTDEKVYIVSLGERIDKPTSLKQ